MTNVEQNHVAGRPRTLATAIEYIGRNWVVIPIALHEKRLSIPGWQNLRIVGEDAHKYFNGKPQNIGVLLGAASGGLVDIDLDSPEALKLADYFLPATDAVFGRIGKLASHRLYICPDVEYAKFNDPVLHISLEKNIKTTACIVEIRTGKNGKGIQTVFPPSVHESGEPIEWERFGEPHHVEAETLRTAVARLAAACLLLKYWVGGKCHHLALATAAALLRGGFDVSDARVFVRAISIAAGDDEIDDRLRAVEDTEKAIAEGRNVVGITALTGLTDPKITRAVGKWLGFKPSSRRIRTEVSTEIQTSFKVLTDGRVVEQIIGGLGIYDPSTGEFTVELSVQDQDGKIYVPVEDPLLGCDGGIYLANDLEEYGSEEELDKAIERYVSTYLDLRPLQLQLTAKYIRFTYIFDKVLELSYLNPTGDMGSGKSRFGLTTCLASRRGLSLINPSAASLFRIVDQYHPTLFIDEANFNAQTDDTTAIIQILNAGFQVTGKIPRQRKGNDGTFVTEMFDPYCPKIIGSLKKSASTALNSRCIEIPMEKTQRNDIPFRLTPKLLQDARILRNKLTLWRLRNFSVDMEGKLEKAEAELREVDLTPRTVQISIPLFALIEDPKLKGEFIKLLRGRDEILHEEKQNTFDGRLVKTIFMLLFEELEDGTVEWRISRPNDGEICEELRIEKITSMLSEKERGRNDLTNTYVGKRINGLGFRTKPILRRGSDYHKKTALVIDLNRMNVVFRNHGLTVPPDLCSDRADQSRKSNDYNSMRCSEERDDSSMLENTLDQTNPKYINTKIQWSERSETNLPITEQHYQGLPISQESDDEKIIRLEREAIETEHCP